MKFQAKTFLLKFIIGGVAFASMMAFVDLRDGHEIDWIKFLIQGVVMGSLFGFTQQRKD